MTARRPIASTWADTGRLPQACEPDPLRDLRAFFAALDEGRMPPPLLIRRYVAIVEDLADGLMRGEQRNLHRMLGLPNRSWSEGRRRLIDRERALAIRAVAAALPQELGPWQRAARVIELLHDYTTPCPDGAFGEVGTLRAGILGKLPRTTRAIHFILAASPEKYAQNQISES